MRRRRSIPLRSPENRSAMRAASGSTAFWQPLASRPAHPVARRIVGCPGFGDTPRDPAVDAHLQRV